MNKLLAAFICMLACHAQAQLASATTTGVKGKFYISVDDEAHLYLNGTDLHYAKFGESESHDCELKAGDRLVVALKNTLGKGRFMTLFMSTDRKQVVTFASHSFKILPEPSLKDFTPADFAAYQKAARDVRGDFGKPYMLPFKSSSKWVWGDVNVSTIGCLITQDMFRPNMHP